MIGDTIALGGLIVASVLTVIIVVVDVVYIWKGHCRS